MSRFELKFEAITQCPVCACPEARPLDSVRDTLVPEINRYLPAHEAPLTDVKNTRVQCEACKLVYLAPRLDSASLREVYRLWYGYAYRSIFSDPQHLQDRATEFRDHHLRCLQRHMPEAGKVLDVGSGSGLFLSIAKEHGWQGIGIELDQATAKWASEQYGLDIRFGTLESAVNSDDKFNAITMFDYLEHTDKPGPDLAAAARHLDPGGVILIRVPNQAGWQSRFMKQNWLAVISNHLSYFSPDSLTNALEANGFEMLEITAVNYRSERDILRQRWQWLMRRLGKATSASNQANDISQLTPSASQQGQSGIKQFGRFLHSLLIEQIDHIGGWFGRSNFLMAVARKK